MTTPTGGFHSSADVIQETIDGVDTRTLWAAYQAAVALRNRDRQTLIDFLTWAVAEPFEGVPLGSSGAAFEKASEYGVPRGYRAAAALNWLGYAFDWFDLATRFTWEFMSEATAAQLDSANQAALEADSNLVFMEVMRTLFDNANRDVDIQTRPYTVYSFYNGNDGVVPPPYKTNTFLSTHTHYITSGAAIIDQGNYDPGAGALVSGDLEDVMDAMAEHGYSREEGYEVIIMLNKQEGDVVRNWRSVANGGSGLYDFIPAQGTPGFLLPQTLVIAGGAGTPSNTLRGLTVIGTYGDAVVIQDSRIPPGYVVGFATGGSESVRNPVGFRQHANPALRGLRLVKGRDDDYPLQEAFYQRGFGTGVRHRGAGVVMEITADATYDPPPMYVP